MKPILLSLTHPSVAAQRRRVLLAPIGTRCGCAADRFEPNSTRNQCSVNSAIVDQRDTLLNVIHERDTLRNVIPSAARFNCNAVHAAPAGSSPSHGCTGGRSIIVELHTRYQPAQLTERARGYRSNHEAKRYAGAIGRQALAGLHCAWPLRMGIESRMVCGRGTAFLRVARVQLKDTSPS